MAASVRVTLQCLRELHFAADMAPGPKDSIRQRAILEAGRVIASSKSRSEKRRPTKQKAAAKRADKNAETAAIRKAAMERAEGKCEFCGLPDGLFGRQLQLDHFAGRARSESVETCWVLCPPCHRAKTDSKPSAEAWLNAFLVHCDEHGYADASRQAEARLAFVSSRSSLGKGVATNG